MIRQCWQIMARTSGIRAASRSAIKRRLLSSAPPPSTSGSNIYFQLIAGGLVVGGSALIAYQHGFINFPPKSKLTSYDSKMQHAKKCDSTETPNSSVIIDHLPELVEYLIIGGGTAAFSASRTIRSNDPKSRVLIISAEDAYPYMRPPLSKELWFSGLDTTKEFTFKQYNNREKSIFLEPEEFYLPLSQWTNADHGGISVVKGHRVIKLDATDRKAYLDNGQIVSYHKCLIATGGKPKNLKVFEEASKEVQQKVVLFRNLKDFKRLSELFPKAQSVTIVGGGFLGSELAFALKEKATRVKSSVKINQLFSEAGVLDKVLPKYLSRYATEKIKAEGIHVISDSSIKAAQVNHNQLRLTLNNDKTLDTDVCIVAVGLEPDVQLAATSGLETDDVLGGYRVNTELQVRSNLWAAGDVACFYDQKFGRRRVEHHDHAVVSGRLAGENMTGGNKPYWHQSMFWSDLGFDMGFEAIGLVDSSLPTFALFAKNTSTEKEYIEEKSIEGTASCEDKYGKGVVLYIKDNSVVGVVLWNLFNNMHIARRIIHDGCINQDLNEVARLFAIYESEGENEAEVQIANENQ